MVVFKINRVAKNLLSVGASSVISQLAMFFMAAYYMRVLSVEDVGRISLVQSILVYFTMITLFGFQTLGTKEVSKNKDNESLIVYITSIRFVVAIVSFIIIIIMSILFNKGEVFKNILIIYGLTLFPIAFNIDWFYSGTQEMRYNGTYNILKNVIPFILLIIFLKDSNGIYLIPIFTLMGLMIAVLYQFYIYRWKKKLHISFKVNKDMYKYYILGGIPFLISGLLSMINLNMDSIIIGFIKGEYELGIYSSAYKIISFLINLIAVVFTPFFPLLISFYHERAYENLENTLKNISKIIMFLALPLTIGGALLSKEIIILLFGEKFGEAYVPFIILLIYIFILFMRETYGYSLNAWNMEKTFLKVVFISALLNLLLNLVLIPKWGYMAAACSTVVSELVCFIMMRKYCFKIIRIGYISNAIKLTIPILLMMAQIILFKYLKINVLINIFIAIILYFLSAIYFKYIKIDDINKLMRK